MLSFLLSSVGWKLFPDSTSWGRAVSQNTCYWTHKGRSFQAGPIRKISVVELGMWSASSSSGHGPRAAGLISLPHGMELSETGKGAITKQ